MTGLEHKGRGIWKTKKLREFHPGTQKQQQSGYFPGLTLGFLQIPWISETMAARLEMELLDPDANRHCLLA